MYNERKESFSFRDIIIQILFVVLFIFILIWLFPTKSSMKKDIQDAISSLDLNGNEIALVSEETRIFNENVELMKDAAKSYFTTPRLPKNVGDKVKMTLGEMLDKKIILPFVDSKGKQCDLTKSYVEITKESEEFILKINLECTDKSDYVLVYVGCYDYCESDICEKKDTTKPVVKTPINNNPTKPTKPTTPTNPTTPAKTYEYEYKKAASYSAWGEWSSWTTTAVTNTDLRKIETSTRYNESTKTVTDYSRPVKQYENKTKSVSCGYTREKVTKLGPVSLDSAKSLAASSGGSYEQAYETVTYNGQTYVVSIPGKYDVYKQIPCTKTETTRVEVGVTYPYTKEEVTRTSYTVYRFATRTYTPEVIKWSTDNDTALLNSGYVKTGNKKEK